MSWQYDERWWRRSGRQLGREMAELKRMGCIPTAPPPPARLPESYNQAYAQGLEEGLTGNIPAGDL